MKKNKFLKLLGVICFITIMFFSFENGYAEKNSKLEILTPTVSADVYEYADKDFGNVLNSILFFEQNGTSIDEYRLGNPFTMFDQEISSERTFYFPVFLDNDIQYLYSIRKDTSGRYVSSISRFLSEELNEIKDTSNDAEIALFTKNEDVFVKKNDQVIKIYETPKENMSAVRFSSKSLDQEDLVTDNENTDIIDVMEKIDYQLQTKLSQQSLSRSTVSTGSNYAMINWSIKETQSTLPWCAAYVTAAILSNKVDSRPARAQDAMNHAYPNQSQAYKEKQGLSRDQAVAYGKSRGTNPIQVNNTVTHSVVESNLRRGNAIYAGGAGHGQSLKSRHAFAIYGWVTAQDNSYRSYYMWNPWWDYPMVVQANTMPITIPVPGGGYVWDVSIYNW